MKKYVLYETSKLFQQKCTTDEIKLILHPIVAVNSIKAKSVTNNESQPILYLNKAKQNKNKRKETC